MNRKLTLILPLLLLGFLFNAKAQCPTNIDWETGTSSNWLYFTGTCCPINTPTAGFVAGRHEVVSSGIDPYGFFPKVAPGGGAYSFKLGNDLTGAQGERIKYNVHVPVGGIYSLIYRYAVVLNDPSHSISQQPRMTVNAVDSITGTAVPCAAYTYVASGSIPGFLLSSITAYGSPVYYKTWTLGNMKFPGYGGKTVTIDFATGDCAATGHFGYGYVDMSCGFFANTVVGCASGTTVLAGPDGYSGYQWFDSATYSTTYGSSQIVTITAPTITTTYAVVLTPYTGYGCPDTLFTKVIPSTLVLTGSNDTAICSGATITLSAFATSANPPITYSWAPSTGLSCTTCSSTSASPTTTTTYTVTATDNTGCVKSEPMTVTVNPMPGAITGSATVCPGATIVLSNSVSGGFWSGGPGTVATIGASSGVVTGITPGVFNVVYTVGGICTVTRTVTVVAAPAPIVPTSPHVCLGSSITLTDPTAGGTWSAPGYGAWITLGTSTGVVTGVGVGTASVTYTVGSTGCTAVRVVTIDPLPGAITGLATVCEGQTTTYSSSPSGGTWTSSLPSTASVSPTTGVITGVVAGTAIITYTLPSGCFTTAPVSVQAIPSAITGPHDVCVGDTISLSDATPSGSWGTSNALIAYPVSFSAMPARIVGAGPGTVTITYTGPSGCFATYTVTVHPIPSPVTGANNICIGSTTLLSDIDPGTWSSTNTSVATIGSGSGVVSGLAVGTTTIILTSPYGCERTFAMTVNPLPSPITGPSSLCVGTSITLSDASTGVFSTSPVIAANVTTGGVVTGIATGVQIITFTESVHGCTITRPITVNTTPPPITGSLVVCQGSTTNLSDIVGGGTWTSSATAIGTIGSTSGVATGLSPGTTTITYSLGAGCSTSSVLTVNTLPGAIIPAAPTVCVGSTIILTDPTTPGGTWSTSSPNASVGASSGVVTGLNFGIAVVTYTLPTTCARTITVTVNALPLPITGTLTVCQGATTTLSSSTLGGTWTSLAIPVATVGPTTGAVFGVITGSPTSATAVIKYTLPSTCAATAIVTVNPLPGLFVVTGGGNYCAGGTGAIVGLSGSTVGINYQLQLGGVDVVGALVAGTGSPITFGPQTAAGTYTVVAINAITGCRRTMTGSATIVVNPLPLPIVGPSAVCVGATITETDGMPGGTWASSSPGVASITSAGVVTGITTGLTTTISYTLPTGCYVTKIVSVSPSPGPIIGPSSVCMLECITYSDAVPGGVWTSSSPAVATAGSLSGSVCGVSSGTTVLTYSLGGSGCTVTKPITVTAAPAPISGPGQVCVGQTITEADATPGGVWSIDPGSVSLVSISSTTGGTTVVTGTGAGVATISYTGLAGAGCGIAKQITVNALPAPIGGPLAVCQGSCGTLTDATPGGVWSISTTTAATLVSTTGVLCGTSVGGTLTYTATVTYTAAGCSINAIATVNPLPGTITGTPKVCVNSTITLGSLPTGGTWTSASTAIATVGSSTGIVTGVASGTTPVTYTLGTGCIRTVVVTVNPVPAAVVGPTAICVGQSALFTDVTPGGTWSSSNMTIAPIGALTGSLTGAMPGGAATIAYTLTSTGCAATVTLNVIPPPAPITGGSAGVCIANCIPLADATPGGSWSSSLPGVATIDPITGVICGVSAGTTIISYGIPGTSCSRIQPIIVNPVAPILGTFVVCQGQTTHLIDTALGGTWSTSSPFATVSSAGMVTGVSAGVATITYTMPTGCPAFADVTVNAIPSIIGGPSAVCQGEFVLETNLVPGGTWSTSNSAVGTIDAATGLTYGVAPGTMSIIYTLPGTGCNITKPFLVNALPANINGPAFVCNGSTVVYSDPSGLGSWTSSATAVATIGSSSGALTGLSVGSTIITFNLFSTGCAITKPVDVVNPPSILPGPLTVCQGGFLTLSAAPAGGIWSSATPSVAAIDPSTGVVSGYAPGNTAITYSLGAGCTTAPVIVTVNPTPLGIMGSSNICVGATTTLTSSPGGTWTSSDPFTADINPVSGVVTGVAIGSAIITYTLPTGCDITTLITVNGGVAPISGMNIVCVSQNTTLSNATPGGTWSSASTGVATVDAFGTVTGVTPGTAVIAYTVPGYFCPAYITVTVNSFPTGITGPLNVCQGSNATYANGSTGGIWTTSDIFTATITSSTASTGALTALVTGVSSPVGLTITYTLGAGVGCSTTLDIVVDPIPAAIFGANNVCEGQIITLTDPTPVSGIGWNSASTSTATVDAFGNVTGVLAGVAVISYTNSYGCAATYPVTVNPSPTAITGSSNVCLGGTTALANGVPFGTWTSLNATIASVNPITGVVTGVTLGTTTIKYQLPAGCVASKSINVSPLPTVFGVTGGGNHCAGDAGVAIGLTGSTVGVNYMLYLGATAVGSFPGTGSALPLGMHSLAGTYTVIGTSTATTCSSNMAGTAVVGIIPSVIPSVTMNVSPNDTVCAGSTVTYTPVPVNGGSGPVYQWSVNGFPVSLSNTYSFIPADGDVVSVSMTSNANCPAPAVVTGSRVMTVQPFGTPNADFVFTPNDTVCQGTVVTATPTSTFAGDAPSYTWIKNTYVQAIAPVYSFLPSDGDIIYCILTSNYPCRITTLDTSAPLTINVDTAKMPVVSITANPGWVISKGAYDTLTASAANAIAPTYQWFINGVPVTGATNATFISNNFNYPNIIDSVSCMVTSNGICVVSAHQWGYVQVTTVGVNNVAAGGDISVMPNPNKGEFVIRGALASVNDEKLTIEVTNMIGQVVYRSEVVVKGGKLNERVMLSNTLANGMYLLNLRTETDNKVFHIAIEQ